MPVLGLLVAMGCGRHGEGLPRSFELEQIAPKEGELFLNHPLVFSFSEAVAPASITRESLHIESAADGRPARGVFRVEGKRVQFRPDPPLSPDLQDGGFRPGTRYEVRVAGFPLPDGIHSADGSPLRKSYRWAFETVPTSGSPRDIFRDRTLGYSERLRLVGGKVVGSEYELSIAPADPIVLECDEPLHPPSVRAGDFSLQRLESGGPTPVPFELALVENHDAGDALALGVARLEIRPAAPLEEGVYFLSYAQNPSLTDLGGNTVHFWTRPIEVRVGSLVGEHVERFLGPEGRSPLSIPGVDGTAWWGSSGVVTIRFPRAAGDGHAGELSLSGELAAKDVQATRILVPGGEECLLPGPGLVVLRAQGALRISGRLARRGGPGPPVQWRPGERLSDWLERAQEEDPAWTVLIAGGDLVIDGRVETTGPLILVAGGWIRATGEVRQQERQLWLLGEGGGMLLDPTRSSMDLEIDPPRRNPLATTLRFAVLSVPLPSRGQVGQWLGARAHGRSGAGSWRVRYLPFREPAEALSVLSVELVRAGARRAAGVGLELSTSGLLLAPPARASAGSFLRALLSGPGGLAADFQPVDDPRQLEPAGKLRIQVELSIGESSPERGEGAWDPPVVDEVDLHWAWDRGEGGR